MQCLLAYYCNWRTIEPFVPIWSLQSSLTFCSPIDNCPLCAPNSSGLRARNDNRKRSKGISTRNQTDIRRLSTNEKNRTGEMGHLWSRNWSSCLMIIQIALAQDARASVSAHTNDASDFSRGSLPFFLCSSHFFSFPVEFIATAPRIHTAAVIGYYRDTNRLMSSANALTLQHMSCVMLQDPDRHERTE